MRMMLLQEFCTKVNRQAEYSIQQCLLKTRRHFFMKKKKKRRSTWGQKMKVYERKKKKASREFPSGCSHSLQPLNFARSFDRRLPPRERKNNRGLSTLNELVSIQYDDFDTFSFVFHASALANVAHFSRECVCTCRLSYSNCTRKSFSLLLDA